jgi:soluble lytic murein transglycosylase-like protein
MADWKALASDSSQWDSLSYDDPRLDAFAHEVEQRYNLPSGILEAVKNAGERTPSKASGRPTVSSAGARGLMQFTAPALEAFQHNVDDPFESIDAAGRYMAEVLPRYNNNAMAAIADYNGGPRQAKPVMEGKAPPAAETQQYLQRVKAYMSKKYGGEE